MYPQSFIEEIKANVDIVKLVGEYTKLKKAGPNLYIGKCPNPEHNDSDPSFRVWSDKKSWACMGCHYGKKNKAFKNYGSDCIAFIQWIKHINWKQAVEYLANKYCIPIPDDKNAKLFIKQKTLCKAYEDNLNGKPYRYLKDRGLDVVDCVDWSLGFDGDKICFPLFDRYKNVLGFTKRWMEVPEGQSDKYRNSNNNPIFNKSMYLYGIHNIDEDFPEIRITEGPMDVILAHKYGAKNIVGTLGTAFTEGHIDIIKHYGLTPVFCLDGDGPGIAAATKAINILAENNIYSKILILPNNLDMAELSLREKNNIENYITSNSKTYGYYMIEGKLNEFNAKLVELQMKYYPEIMDILAKVPSQKEKKVLQLYMKKNLFMYDKE